MISFQRLLGREEEFFDLLVASAGEACKAVEALNGLLKAGSAGTLDSFIAARRRDKEITSKLEEMLLTNFVTPMEREDLEALAEALYKIPKTVEKFAERYLIVSDKVSDIDFSCQVKLMEKAIHLVRQMVQSLKEGRDLGGIKALQNELQLVETEADDTLLSLIEPLYRPGFPALKAVILHDLFSLNEKVVDRCRDAGNVLSHVLLKNS